MKRSFIYLYAGLMHAPGATASGADRAELQPVFGVELYGRVSICSVPSRRYMSWPQVCNAKCQFCSEWLWPSAHARLLRLAFLEDWSLPRAFA